MRNALFSAAIMASAAFATPALAQVGAVDDTDYETEWNEDETLTERGEGLSAMADKLSDPVQQQQMAFMLQTLSEVVLDLPIAPLAEAAATIAGEDPESVDPNLTVREVAPGASRLTDRIGEDAPRIMGAMAGFAEGLNAMLPALEQMARTMKDAVPNEY